MQGILFLAILSVRTSYTRDTEEPAQENQPADTVQWWISPAGTWRIRTYALDHDIHTHSIADTCDLLELARDTTLKHYSDVLRQQHEIVLNDTTDHAATSSEFRAAGLDPTGVEIAPDRFLFWRPDDARYRSQSTPR
jgi:hypothetical protein